MVAYLIPVVKLSRFIDFVTRYSLRYSTLVFLVIDAVVSVEVCHHHVDLHTTDLASMLVLRHFVYYLLVGVEHCREYSIAVRSRPRLMR